MEGPKKSFYQDILVFILFLHIYICLVSLHTALNENQQRHFGVCFLIFKENRI